MCEDECETLKDIRERLLRIEILLEQNVSEYLTVNEAAKFTRFAPKSIYNMVSQGTIPYLKKGGKTLFKRVELVKWMDQGFVRRSTASDAYRNVRI